IMLVSEIEKNAERSIRTSRASSWAQIGRCSKGVWVDALVAQRLTDPPATVIPRRTGLPVRRRGGAPRMRRIEAVRLSLSGCCPGTCHGVCWRRAAPPPGCGTPEDDDEITHRTAVDLSRLPPGPAQQRRPLHRH